MEKVFLTTIKYSSDEIIEKRNMVRQDLVIKSANIKNGNIKEISISDLNFIFQLYDKYFLKNYFTENFKGILEFSLSKRMTRSAGITVQYRRPGNKDKAEKYEIKIGVNFFFKFNEIDRDKMVNGICAKDSLEALLLVMEHEICHLIEFHVYGNSDCGKGRFRSISVNLFKHNGRYHELPTNTEIANEKFGLKIGDNVYFNHEGKTMKGIIYKINVRATVMVADNKGRYSDAGGIRYAKWYVPLVELKRLS